MSHRTDTRVWGGTLRESPNRERPILHSRRNRFESHRQAPAAHAVALAATLGVAFFTGCAGLPPGAHFPREASVTRVPPEATRLGAQWTEASRQRNGKSGFRLLNAGVDGFLTRVQMIDASERSLDLQYFIFRGDETGQQIMAALLRAADRGVAIRILVDDGDTVTGDSQLLALDAYPQVQVRVFNPFVYRGDVQLFRGLEFLFNWQRVDYRMHNKLLVSDNAMALIGGRNIGNQYFQMDPVSQLADDDLFSVGPVVPQLSASFDEFWNSPLSIPAAALGRTNGSPAVIEERHSTASAAMSLQALDSAGVDYAAMIASGEPYAGMVSGRLPLVWADARLIADSPDKKLTEQGLLHGRLMARPVLAAANKVREELLMVTPYFIPTTDEVHVLEVLLQRRVRVAIITNSLPSNTGTLAQAGYVRYRRTLLDFGADLFEVRASPGNEHGSGQTARLSKFGHYGLHAKLFVFDRETVFIGSMNYDQRSKRLNTEIGVMIDSPELARQVVARFDHMSEPENAYVLSLRDHGNANHPEVVWDTVEAGQATQYTVEPARNAWQRLKFRLLRFLPVDSEL